jgi:beta-phosphoglucomutase-like phosphatase (HAD superfamily)
VNSQILVNIIIPTIIGILPLPVIYAQLSKSEWFKACRFKRQLIEYKKKVQNQIYNNDPNFLGYFSLNQEFNFNEDYVEQNGSRIEFSRGKEVSTPIKDSLEKHLLKSLNNKEIVISCVVGEFGTGKSSLLLYVYREYLKNHCNKTKKIPIIASMKSFKDPIRSCEDLLSQLLNFLKTKYNIELEQNLFEKNFMNGDVLLFLDGFDEYVLKYARSPFTLMELGKTFGQNSKVIITTRHSAFRDPDDFRNFVSLSDINLAANNSKMEILEIELLQNKQIQEILMRKKMEKSIQYIFSNEHILELCRQHLLLKMVIADLPDITSRLKISDIYELYIKNGFPSEVARYAPQMFAIFEKIAVLMYKDNSDTISSDDILCAAGEQLTELKISINDLLFLTRTTGNSLRFMHRSFMEYFVARWLVNAIRKQNLEIFDNIKSVVYHEEISKFSREMLLESDIQQLLALLNSPKPWVRFIGAHFLSRLNITTIKDLLISLINGEIDFIAKREFYISIAFLGEVEKFHEYIELIADPVREKCNDDLIFAYFSSKIKTINGCVNRLIANPLYPTREMLVDYLGRHGGKEHIAVLRQFVNDPIEHIRVTSKKAILSIKSRSPVPRITKLAIFDMDGVIIDSIDFHIDAWVAAAKSLGIDFNFEKAEKMIRLTEGKKNVEIAEDILQLSNNTSVLPFDFVQIKEKIVQSNSKITSTKNISQLIHVMKNLGIKVAVVTGSNQEWANYVLRSLKLESKIDLIITADDVREGKPSSEPYRLALKLLEIG